MIYISLASDSCVVLTPFSTEPCRWGVWLPPRASRIRILVNDLQFQFQILLTLLRRWVPLETLFPSTPYKRENVVRVFAETMN
jgi:hypothetical protein